MSKKRFYGMNWFGYLISFILILLAMFAMFNMIKVFTATSTTTGSITETKFFEKVTDFEFNGSKVQLMQNNNQFTYSTDLKAVNDFDGTTNSYELLINNQPCATNSVGAGEMESTFVLTFYNSNGTVAANPTLIIQIKFYTTRTNINLVTFSSANDVGYLQSYIANDGFNMQLVYSKR